MSYQDTFIQIPDDSAATAGVVPSSSRAQPPIHVIQYELLSQQPYTYNHEELVFAVHVRRAGITAGELAERREGIWAELFRKGHPCMRASALTKQYGWGAHYDAEGRIALYGRETPEYAQFVDRLQGTRGLLMAMRRKRR